MAFEAFDKSVPYAEARLPGVSNLKRSIIFRRTFAAWWGAASVCIGAWGRGGKTVRVGFRRGHRPWSPWHRGTVGTVLTPDLSEDLQPAKLYWVRVPFL